MNNLNYRNNGYQLISLNHCLDFLNNFGTHKLGQLYYNYSNYSNDSHHSNHSNSHLKFLGKGGQGRAYLIHTGDCGYVVIKISPIRRSKSKSEFGTESGDDSEIAMIPLCRDIVDRSISPNFLYYYGTKNIGNFTVILSEYADGTIENWIQTSHTYDEWQSFMFQFLIAVLCIQTILMGYHSDLKPKNIFYKKISTPYFKYYITGSSTETLFLVPTYGYMYLVADFGHMQSLLLPHNKLNANSIKLFMKNNIDLEHIFGLYKRIMVTIIEKTYNINQLITLIKNQASDEYFEGYYDTKKNEIERDMKNYPQKIKDKMLFKSVCYYVVEKKYITVEDIRRIFSGPGSNLESKNDFGVVLPPDEFIKELQILEVEASKHKIIDLLSFFRPYYNNSIERASTLDSSIPSFYFQE